MVSMKDQPVIDVRMCGNPACGGLGACANVPAGALAGLSDSVDRSRMDDALLLRFFAQELALSPCSDDRGVMRMIPLGSEFTVHVGPAASGGGAHCAAVYSGPARTKDEWLAGSPVWSGDRMQERLALLRNTT